MKTKLFLIGILLFLPSTLTAKSRIYSPQIKSLQAVVNQDWLSLPVMRLASDDHLHIGFDELSHDYHSYTYRIERCEADWSVSQEVFESDWLEGFNDNPIEDVEHSINTTVPYTHYQLTLPNDRCRLKMSGNYRLHIAETGLEDVLTVEFMVTEQTMTLQTSVSANTDIDTNARHQQLTILLKYRNHTVTVPQEQLQTVVMQNGREDNWRRNPHPSSISSNGLEWQHCPSLIFDGGNEYHKYEILDPGHPTMGIDHITWDGNSYQAFPFLNEPRQHYLYDEDADGAFYIRNSDNRENDTSSDYVWVNYRLKSPPLSSGNVVIDGQWTTEAPETYQMKYDTDSKIYTARILQKQGYYSYQYLWMQEDGTMSTLPSEGSFYQTANCYQILVYYRGTGERTWRLTAYQQLTMR